MPLIQGVTVPLKILPHVAQHASFNRVLPSLHSSVTAEAERELACLVQASVAYRAGYRCQGELVALSTLGIWRARRRNMLTKGDSSARDARRLSVGFLAYLPLS